MNLISAIEKRRLRGIALIENFEAANYAEAVT
jgi:hypothetical protein